MLDSNMRRLLESAFSDFDLKESATILEADEDEENGYDGVQDFSYDNAGMEELGSFLDTYGADPDEEELPVEVVDLEADSENDLKQSYIGKVIVDCSTCHGNLYLDPDELTVNEDGESTFDGECPYCMSDSGFTVIGEVQPYEPGVDAEDMEDELEDGEDIDIDAMEEEPVEDELPEEDEEFEESLQLEDYADSKSMDAVDALKGEPSLHRRKDNIKEDDAINGESENAKKIVGTKTYKESLLKEGFDETPCCFNCAYHYDDWCASLDKKVDPDYCCSEFISEDDVDYDDFYENYDGTTPQTEQGGKDAPVSPDFPMGKEEPVEQTSRGGKPKLENLSEKRGIPQTAGRGTPKVSKDAPKGKAKSVPQTERGGKAMAEAVTLDTMDDVTVSQTPGGGISVSSEPAEGMMDGQAEIEMIAPISDEVEAELPPEALPLDDEEGMGDDLGMDDMGMEEPPMDDLGMGDDMGMEDEEDIPVDDFDEDSFDELGEAFLMNTYDNVAGFRTTMCEMVNESLNITGEITFTSGKKGMTTFAFTPKAKKNGVLTFEGLNKQITPARGTLAANATVKGNKLVFEKMAYSYKRGLNESAVQGVVKTNPSK